MVKSMLNDRFPKIIKNASSTQDGLMSAEDKSRLDSVFEFGLLRPSTQESDGLMSKEDKVKLDNIENNANNYIHPEFHPATMITEDATHRFVTDEEKNKWNNIIEAIEIVTYDNNGLMLKEDKVKLDGIEENANNYTHPSSHPATIITEDSTHRFVTDTEKNKWNNIISTLDIATTSNDGLMSKEDKTKLDDIEEGANNYVHPTTHSATMITEDATHRFVTDEEKNKWNNFESKINLATQTENGLMSKTDKTKLDGIAIGANNYVHPTTHSATMIIEDATHRFVTDEEKNKWNNIIGTLDIATQNKNGLMAKEDKVKLDGIASNANNYVHPSTHLATMITEDATHRFVTDNQIVAWTGKADTAVVSTTANGLMSKEDKVKLESLLTRMIDIEKKQAEMLTKLKSAVFI